jgi:hypothetical protein
MHTGAAMPRWFQITLFPMLGFQRQCLFRARVFLALMKVDISDKKSIAFPDNIGIKAQRFRAYKMAMPIG